MNHLVLLCHSSRCIPSSRVQGGWNEVTAVGWYIRLVGLHVSCTECCDGIEVTCMLATCAIDACRWCLKDKPSEDSGRVQKRLVVNKHELMSQPILGWTAGRWKSTIYLSIYLSWMNGHAPVTISQPAERGSAQPSSLRGRKRAIVNQTNIGTVSRATLGKLPRDGVERIWAFPSA